MFTHPRPQCTQTQSQAGKRAPKYPKQSTLLKSDISTDDSGFATDFFKQYLLSVIGYRQKNEPSMPIDAGLDGPNYSYHCKHCRTKEPNRPQIESSTVRTCLCWCLPCLHKRVPRSIPAFIHQYPTIEALMEHLGDCPHAPLHNMFGYGGEGPMDFEGGDY